MIEPVAADPERLHDLVAQMTAVAETIGDARNRLENTLAAEGRCWGADETGVAFAASYLPASRMVRSMLASTESGIHGLAGVLATVTTLLETADHDAGRAGR